MLHFRALKTIPNHDEALEIVHDTFILWKYKVETDQIKGDLESCCGYAKSILDFKLMEYRRKQRNRLAHSKNQSHFDFESIELEDY